MIEQLESILSPEGKEISALLKILSEQEKAKLHRYFDSAIIDKIQNRRDIEIKLFALNALFIYIKNNPAVEKKLQDKSILTEKLASKIYELANILYQYEKSWNHYFYLVAYAILADKQTLLSRDQAPPTSNNFLDELLYFFTEFSFPPRSQKDREELNNLKENLKARFDNTQQAKNISNHQQIFEIIAGSNLVNLGEKLHQYLLEGKGSNITADINNQTANAIKVFTDTGNRDWELICSLLRFVLQKHYDNSIWTHANRLPFFKEFIEKQIEKKTFIFSLFPSQKAVLQDILSSQKSTVISMPTSSGKTLLAELKILYTRSLYSNNCLCAYVVPTIALVNQTLKRLKTSLPDLKIEQLLPYNHFDQLEKELTGEDPDVLVSTPEKLNFLLKNPDAKILDNLRLVIVDEAHNISDPSRGSIWEFLLANLKQNDEQLSYLLLTPFIRNKDELGEWLGNNTFTAKSVEWTPTKQYVAYHSLHKKDKTQSKINYLPSARNSIIKEEISIDLNTNINDIKKEIKETSINDKVRNTILVEKYSKQKGCILILHKGTNSAEKLAESLSMKFNFSIEDSNEKLNYAKEIIKLELTSNHSLIELLNKGIAFHHSKLPPLVKEVIEDLVTSDLIKVLVATTTLAQGMNFPIKTVIFETIILGGGSNTKNLTYNNFWNIAGRAGRAFKDTEGHIVLGWKETNKKTKEKLESFISSDVEDTISSLKDFFDKIEDQEISYDFIKSSSIAQNFLHYLNHLMNVSFRYNLDSVKKQDIVNILSNSLYFKQSEFKEGFLETQEKIVSFSQKYILSIKEKKASQLKLADTLGITDISLSTIIGITQNNRPLLSECIDKNNIDDLAIVIDAINKIPELKISLGRQKGSFQPKLIASIMIDWINGKTIAEISKNNALKINDCSGYIFSRLKNYIPWGMAIYQKISDDQNDLLPSYAFYGVKNEKSVKLSYIGIPRFALNNVKKSIKDDHLYKDIQSLRKFIKDQKFSVKNNIDRSDIINQIIKKSLI